MAVIYAILLIFVYVASKFTEIVRLDDENPYAKDYLEKYGFFTYMYVGGIAYIAYMLSYVVNHPHVSENPKVRNKLC